MRRPPRSCTCTSTVERAVFLPVCVVLVICLAAATASAGAWGREPWSVYTKLSFRYYTSDQSFTRGVANGLEYDALSWDLYAEVGFPDRLSMIFALPYVIAANRSSSGFTYRNYTFGDGRFELDYRALESFPLSFGVEVRVPLYDPVVEQSTDGLVEVDGELWPVTSFPEVGDGALDITPKVMVGYAFNPFPAWIELEVGYRGRFGGFVDGIAGALGGGAFVWPSHIAVGVYTSGVVNLSDDPDPDIQATKQYLSVQGWLLITADPWIPDLGLTFSGGGVVAAENTATGQDFSVGLSYTF